MRSAIILCFVLAAVVVLTHVAGAQQSQSSPTWSADLFKEDSADFKDGAADAFKNAAHDAWNRRSNLAPGQCPKPKVTVSVRKGDELFQQAVATAQKAELQALLAGNADKFAWATNLAGNENKIEIDGSLTDTVAPTVTLVPPSGTKVKIGQRVTIKVTATEPATGWQSGVKRIQIEDVDQRSNLQLWTNTASTPRPCANAGLTKTVEATGRVPDRPAWRLRVTATDYANNRMVQPVEYPTGDWYGAIEFSETLANGRHWGRYDIALETDGRGNLKGRMTGTRHWDKETTPSQLSAKLVGQYTPGKNAMSVTIVEPKQTAGTFDGRHPWGGGLLWVEPLQRHFRNLTVANDGRVSATFDVWGERWRLSLRQATK